ncbi:MAG: glutaredoxin family protein [Gammaproteobacteria bacterium]|nr:glutaredoxin family protein [Gammaproteobacteria bacterium]
MSSPDQAASAALILFQRDDCPLCDQALEVLARARVPEFETVWIDGDDALEGRYGIRVPVLRDGTTGRELDWPFDADMARDFVAGA